MAPPSGIVRGLRRPYPPCRPRLALLEVAGTVRLPDRVPVAPLQQLNLKVPPAVLDHWRAQAAAQGLSVRDWLVSIACPTAAGLGWWPPSVWSGSMGKPSRASMKAALWAVPAVAAVGLAMFGLSRVPFERIGALPALSDKDKKIYGMLIEGATLSIRGSNLAAKAIKFGESKLGIAFDEKSVGKPDEFDVGAARRHVECLESQLARRIPPKEGVPFCDVKSPMPKSWAAP